MKPNKINLVYCEENFSTAYQIENDLSKAGFKFKHIGCNPTLKPLSERRHEISGPAIVLISDNFLKSSKCMQNIYPLIQELKETDGCKLVIIDGEYKNLDGTEKTPTRFDRISHVIQYMNYWQDQYLDMRSVKNNIPLQEQDAYSNMLKVIRDISGQFGDLLRFYKENKGWKYVAFRNNHYNEFFKEFGDDESYKEFCKIPLESQKSFESILTAGGETNPGKKDFIISKSKPKESGKNKEKRTLAFNKNDLKVTDDDVMLEKVIAYKSKEEIEKPLRNVPQISKQNVAEKNAPENILDKIVAEVVEEEIKQEQASKTDQHSDSENLPTAEKIQDFFEAENQDESESPEPEIEFDEIIINVDDLDDEEDDFDDDDFDEDYEEDDNELDVEDEISDIINKQKLPQNTLDAVVDEVVQEEMDSVNDPELALLNKINSETPDAVIPATTEKTTPEEVEEVVDTLESILQGGYSKPSFDFPVEPGHDFMENPQQEFDTEEIISDEDFDVTASEESFPPKVELPPVVNIQNFNTKNFLREIEALHADSKTEEAFQKLEQTVHIFPDNRKLKFQYAVALDDYKNDTRAAINQLEELIEQDPGNLKAYLRLADIAEKHHDFLLAKNYYEKVLQLDPDKAKVHYKLGYIFLNYFPDKEKKAARAFRKAFTINNKLTDARFQYALLLAHYYGKPVKAIKQFKNILVQDQKHADALFELAMIYRQLGKRDKAKKFFNRASKIDPSFKTEENKKRFSYKISYRHEVPAKQGVQAKPVDPIPVKVVQPAEMKTVQASIDKTVFITGATSGIGLATAKLFAANGYRLILGGRRKTKLQTIKEDFKEQFGASVLLLPFDVRNLNAMEDAIGSLENPWQQIDILINNAGLAVGKDPIHEGHFEDWNTMIDTNIKGLLYLTRAIAPQMVERNSGHIINVCSSAGHEVYPGGNVYCATKHAVDALTKGMRLDLFRHNIRVSQVSPGHVEETEFALVRYKGDEEKAKIFKNFQPLKAKDVAEAIYFIASQPSHVTIQDIVLMGTQQANNVFIDDSGR